MKMHEKKIKRFNLYKKIANVLFVLTVIVGSLVLLASLAGGIYLTTTGYNLLGLVDKVISSVAPEVTISLPQGYQIPYIMIFVVIVQIGLSFALTAYIIKSIANLFGNIVSSETPFTQNTVKCIKHLGIALLAYAGILFVISILTGTVITHTTGMNFNANIDSNSIFFGILLLALSEIFSFGMSLQQDSESIV